MDKTDSTSHDFRAFIIMSLEKSWNNYISNLNFCRQKFSEKAVHDLRVSIRRLLSFIILLDDIMPNAYTKRLRKPLKKQLKLFNPLRDTQVQLALLKDLIYSFPVLYSYYNHLLKSEINMIESLKQKTEEFSEINLQGDTLFLKIYLKSLLLDSPIGFSELFDYSQGKFIDVLNSLGQVNANELSTIHSVRLAFKKYRYINEILQPVTHISSPEIKRMKKFQTVLGNIQDNRVFFDNLLVFISAQEEIPHDSYSIVKEDILAKRAQLMSDFLDQAGQVHTFWNKKKFRV